MQFREQENYIIKKLKSVKSKLYQAYLIPFGIDFTFRLGAAVLSSFVGKEYATIIGISILTITRIKAVKDLFDVTKGILETEKLQDPTLTIKKMFANDFKDLIYFKFKKKIKKESKTNSVSIIFGALAPMLFDYFSMGIAASHGTLGVVITQGIDTLLHISSLIILYSNIKKINEKLNKFNTEYYNPFKTFVNESLTTPKKRFISKIINLNKYKLKDILDKKKTNQNPEKIRRFLVNSKNINNAIKNAINVQEWEQFYLQFPNEVDNAERSIRKYGNKYAVITKIIDKNEKNNKYGSPDLSRETYTVEIDENRYKEFLKLNGNNPIYKLTCYTIPIKNVETTILLDVYKDMFEGLNIARVKFKDSLESSKFIKPKWFGKEITTDTNYTGKHFPYKK